MYLKYKMVACPFDKLPKDVFQEIFKFLPLKDLVSARAVSPYFRYHIDKIQALQAEKSFKVGDLCSFMTFKIKARIRIKDIQEILDMSRTISQNQASLSTIHDNFQYLKSHMKSDDITKWINKNSECTVTWGLSGVSSHVELNTKEPSIYGVIKKRDNAFVGAILTVDELYELRYESGPIDLHIRRGSNGSFWKYYGCEIDKAGRLEAGKIAKRVYRHPDGEVREWVGCEINADGGLVAGKIEKRVRRFS